MTPPKKQRKKPTLPKRAAKLPKKKGSKKRKFEKKAAERQAAMRYNPFGQIAEVALKLAKPSFEPNDEDIAFVSAFSIFQLQRWRKRTDEEIGLDKRSVRKPIKYWMIYVTHYDDPGLYSRNKQAQSYMTEFFKRRQERIGDLFNQYNSYQDLRKDHRDSGRLQL